MIGGDSWNAAIEQIVKDALADKSEAARYEKFHAAPESPGGSRMPARLRGNNGRRSLGNPFSGVFARTIELLPECSARRPRSGFHR